MFFADPYFRRTTQTSTPSRQHLSASTTSSPSTSDSNPTKPPTPPSSGQEITLEGETYYKISAVDRMRPFFMSIVSHSDHWMFIASNGGLSAGRKNSDFALFPYYTDDKITEAAETTGSKTVVLVDAGERRMLWQPFSDQNKGVYRLERNLYKNAYGNKVLFEEVNHDLGLTFQYQWAASEKLRLCPPRQADRPGLPP